MRALRIVAPASVAALALSTSAAWAGGALIADARADWVPGMIPGDTNSPPDSAGIGVWEYLLANNANPTVDPTLQTLAWDTMIPGYESPDFLHVDGFNTTSLTAENSSELGMYSNAPGSEWVFLRWTAGPGVPSMLSIDGSARKDVAGGNGLELFLYVDGIRRRTIEIVQDNLVGETFSIEVSDVEPGTLIDLVHSNNGDTSDDLALITLQIREIPAPAGLPLLALAITGAARRRR